MPMGRGWERDKVPEQQMDNEYSYVSLFIVATACRRRSNERAMTVGCDSEKVAIEREQRHACMGYAERERVRRSQMQLQNEVTEHGIEDGARTCLSEAK